MKNIAIAGAGGFGREVKTIIDSINQIVKEYEFIGFFDDGVSIGSIVNGFPVLGGIEEINNITEPLALAIAIGDPKVKRKVVKKITNPLISYPTLIHPNVLVSSDGIEIGEGCIICGGTIITCNIIIEKFVILNLSCTVGHDTIIEKFSSFMPAVNISGEVIIREGVYVGTGTKIINQVEIGENAIIGAGAVVAKSLPPNCTAVGIPAKAIKFHDK